MTVMVNHNYPTIDALLVVNEAGDPIEGAEIRIFRYTAFEAGEIDTWEALTTTDEDGKWEDPIALDDGETWVVHIQKLSEYGPVHVEITT